MLSEREQQRWRACGSQLALSGAKLEAAGQLVSAFCVGHTRWYCGFGPLAT